MQHRAKNGIRGWLWAALAALALIAIMAASLGMYEVGRNRADKVYSFGGIDAPDRAEVSLSISRIDTATQTATIAVNVFARGALADEAGDFRTDAVLLMPTAAKSDPIPLKAGHPVSTIDTRLELLGTTTDYPFDTYHTRPVVQVLGSDGRAVPTMVTIANNDAFFQLASRFSAADGGDPTLVDLTLDARRTTPTTTFAVFLMVLMLGLAIAVVTTAYYVLRWRRGLLFPACSLMAVMLFAVVPLRNAVPGNPPIGSVIDFASFFLAEGIISVALIVTVMIGYRVEIAMERVAARQ
ncbi:DUF4436 family protein [Nocardia sp. NPDC051570]|uniref:DUF4436 family protein n=1 Tax=Nocardia sp. NPDC051570 TaxID=3364324 RepID=UPI00379695F7